MALYLVTLGITYPGPHPHCGAQEDPIEDEEKEMVGDQGRQPGEHEQEMSS